MRTLEKIKYDRNYLERVIFRLDYHPMLVIQASISPEFQDAVRSFLPIIEEKKGLEYTAKITAGKAESESKPVSQWLFSDKENRFKLTLTHGFLAFEDFKYTSLSPYATKIQDIVNTFEKAYNDIDYTRVGLRYINKITLPDGDPLAWNDFIADALLCPIDQFIGEKRELSRAMSQYVVNKGDCSVLFNFGIFNREFPAKISRREYILDYDCFSSDVDRNKIIEQLRRYNLFILELFEHSIKEQLRSEMGSRRE